MPVRKDKRGQERVWETRGSLPEPMLPLPFTVRKTRKETHDTYTLELQSESRPGGLAFAAGQFNMLYAFGAGEVPVSISGDPAAPEVLVHTVRAVGPVTRAISGVKPGDMLGVRGPFGTRWPLEDALGSDVVVVAGGIGLAPLRPALYQLFRRRRDYKRVALLYGARSPRDILYRRELGRWDKRPGVDVHVTVDHATEGWGGNEGVVTALIPKVEFDPAATVVMVCGPEIMMRFTVIEFQKRGVPSEKIYISMERNMQCGIGLCGHCQLGPYFVCKDGPVFRFGTIETFFGRREI